MELNKMQLERQKKRRRILMILGVVAAVLQDENVTWVNLYKSNGDSIASDKTTVSESGYPLDIDLSPDGQKLAVSYLGVKEGNITSDVVFYHFVWLI